MFSHLMRPLLRRIAEEVEKGQYEEAVEGFFGLFERLAEVKAEHEEWFETMFKGGESTDIAFLTDAAVVLYCHLRQKEDLSPTLAEKIDQRLEKFNEKTQFFGDWTVDIYTDMLHEGAYQIHDYSKLEDIEIWRDYWK